MTQLNLHTLRPIVGRWFTWQPLIKQPNVFKLETTVRDHDILYSNEIGFLDTTGNDRRH